MTEHVVVSMGHNRLSFLAKKIQAGYERCIKGGEEWIEGSIEVGGALREGRDAVPNNIGFSGWLKVNQLDFYPAHERAALINLAADLAVMRAVLTETKSRSYQLIWREFKHRYASANKTPLHRARGTKKPRMMGTADIHRRLKLGDKTVDSLKGTSLDSAPEMDELILQNRGAAPGELLPEVKQLVADAVAGKDVSAIAKGRGRAPKLLAAWRKRMVVSWVLATKEERTELIEYLMNHLEQREAPHG